MRMNIAFIGVGMLSGDSSQGIPAFITSVRELAKTNDVTVYSFIRVDPRNSPVRVRYIPSQRIPQNLQFIFLTLLFILDHLRKKYNVIHAQSPFPGGHMALFLHRLLGVPWILSFHAGEASRLPDVPFGDLLDPFLEKVNRKVTQQAKHIHAMSAFQAALISESFETKAKIRVLPRGINSVGALPVKEITLPVRILHISNAHPVKGPRVLLRAFQEIRKRFPATLRIVGANYGVDFSSIVRELDLEDDVKIEGRIPNDQLKFLFSESHILLHPAYFEALPMVGLEAMANGVVVCGTNVGIMADLSGKYCLTAEVGNSQAVAATVISLVENSKLFNELRVNAFDWVRSHGLTWYKSETEKYFAEVCRESK